MKRTTDEWTERFFEQATKDIDCHIEMTTDLSSDDAYTLRRLIMITLRQGKVGVGHLTDEIDKLETEVAGLERRLRAVQDVLIKSPARTK